MKLSQIFEEVTNPTMKFYHGGNLDLNVEYVPNKKGRYEYGVGLYLTTHLETAMKYAKGSRKLYEVKIKKGTKINDVNIPIESVIEFIKSNVIKSKQKEIVNRISKYIDNGKVNANRINVIILNEDGIKPNNMNSLREFLINNGVDYAIEYNTFGWGETMVILFNMKKIVEYKQINPKDLH